MRRMHVRCQDLPLFRSKESSFASQVAELFDLGSPPSSGSALTPVSNRELLAALLAALRDSHWCKAVDCQSEPGLMVPISLEVAASGSVQPMHGFDIARALAAAERRLFLLPDSRYNCCERKGKRKENVTDHNGSLLRRQPGAIFIVCCFVFHMVAHVVFGSK